MSLVKINLITWERNPRMRKKNNVISFLVDKDEVFGKDIILHSSELDGESLTYEVLNVKTYRPSTIKGKFYVVARVKCLRNNDRNTGPKKN